MGLEGLGMSRNMPIIHQAVLAEQHGLKGNLSLYKVLGMGFDVNVLDQNGEGALHQMFRAS